MFEETDCKHPIIVLKDIAGEEFELLLSYMYVGEVNVVQDKLSGLIKAAECLKIKGLAVPDEEPPSFNDTPVKEKRKNESVSMNDSKRARTECKKGPREDSENARHASKSHKSFVAMSNPDHSLNVIENDIASKKVFDIESIKYEKQKSMNNIQEIIEVNILYCNMIYW